MAAVFHIIALSGGPVDIAEVWQPQEPTLYMDERQKLITESSSVSSKSTRKCGAPTTQSPTADLSEDSRRSKVTALKNIIGVAVSFGAFSLAFFCLQGLQSSINSLDGLGLISLSVLYLCLIISCFYTPVVVRLFGTKHTLVIGYVLATGYTITNAFPSWYTLIPSTAILGLFYGPLWTSVNVHLTTVAIHYATALDQSLESLVVTSAGILYFSISVGEIIGDFATSIILFHSYASVNETDQALDFSVTDDIHASVIANSSHGLCNNSDVENMREMYLYILISFFVVVNAASITLVVCCVSKLQGSGSKVSSTSLMSTYVKKPLLRLLKTSVQYKMCLLLPMFFYSGMEAAFLFGQYTKTYVSDCIGVHWIGFVDASFAVMVAITSLAGGKLVKIVPTYVLVAAAAIVHGGVVFFLLFWERSPSFVIVFAVAGAWGAGDGVWSTQMIGITGILFSDSQEAAFSIMRVWRSIGYLFGFLSTYILSLHQQLWIMVGQITLTLITYTALVLATGATNRNDNTHSCWKNHGKNQKERNQSKEKAIIL